MVITLAACLLLSGAACLQEKTSSASLPETGQSEPRHSGSPGLVHVGVRTDPESLPVAINAIRQDPADPSLPTACLRLGTIKRSEDRLDISTLGSGTWTLLAVHDDSSNPTNGASVVGLADVRLRDGGEAQDVVIVDDRQPLEVDVTDGGGRPAGGIVVEVASTIDPLTSVQTNDEGRVRLRLAGRGHYAIRAFTRTVPGVMASPVRIAAVPDNPVRMIVWPTTVVEFPIAHDWAVGDRVRTLRCLRAGDEVPVLSCLRIESATVSFFVADLRAGAWTIEALNDAGEVLLRRNVRIEESNSQEVPLGP